MDTQPQIVIATAMQLEAEPFLNDLQFERTVSATQTWQIGFIEGVPVAVVVTGIGLVNAAVAAARSHMLFAESMRAYLCAGTTGGLGADVRVRDIIVGSEFLYSRADATAFGYQPGQVPGLPPTLKGSAPLTKPLKDSALAMQLGCHVGQVASSDAFITANTVESARETFPNALAADMESAAAAQVCWQTQIPFVSVRGVSDLCGPRANEDFHIDSSKAAELSASVVKSSLRKLLDVLASSPSR